MQFRIHNGLPIPIIPARLGGRPAVRKGRLSLSRASRVSGWSEAGLKSLHDMFMAIASNRFSMN